MFLIVMSLLISFLYIIIVFTLFTFMSKTKTNHALNNAIGHMENMVEYFETGSYIKILLQQLKTKKKSSKKLERLF